MKLAMLGSFGLVLAAAATSAAAEPALELTGVDETLATDDGCPQGSYTAQVSSDNRALVLRFFDYQVHAGGAGPSVPYEAKTCRMILTFNVPAGWSIGIDRVDVNAHAALADQQSQGSIENSYETEFAGREMPLLSRSFAGPYNGDFGIYGEIGANQIEWTRCDANTQKRIGFYSRHAAQASGFSETSVTEDLRYGAVVHTYRIQWRQCQPPPPPPPPPASWFANCRIVHETIWGSDLREFWGQARGRSQQEALAYARQSGLNQCEAVRGGDNLTRCVVDNGQCAATQQ